MFAAAPLLALALAAPARAGDVSADADLIATCAAFDVLERAYQATDFACEEDGPAWMAAEAERARITEAQRPLVEQMTDFRAATLAGIVARARSLALWDGDILSDAPGDTGECLLSATLRDLIGSSP